MSKYRLRCYKCNKFFNCNNQTEAIYHINNCEFVNAKKKKSN